MTLKVKSQCFAFTRYSFVINECIVFIHVHNVPLDKYSKEDLIEHNLNLKLNFLYRKGQFLTYYTRRLLVMSFIQCHFDYASSAWFYVLTQELKNKLQLLHNKHIRFVLNIHPRSHIDKEQCLYLKLLPAKRVNHLALCHVLKLVTIHVRSFYHS
jgi:hypothetical protein